MDAGRIVLVALLLWVPLLEARRLRKSFGLVGRSLEEACNKSTAELDFLSDSLEPSFGDPSLLFGYPTNITLFGEDVVLYVDIGGLALALLEVSSFSNGIAGFDQDKEFFGRNGKYTKEIISQHALLHDFWKVPDEQILVAGLHSEPLQGNIELAIRTQAVETIKLYNITGESVLSSAEQIKQAIEDLVPGNYSNPFLSYEAFFVDLFDVTDFGNSTVIVMGDGLIDFFESLGLGEVGSDLIHAHEFSHALQFYLDLEDFGGNLNAFYEFEGSKGPDEARKDELEADAMAAYVLAHEQGRDFDVQFLVQVSKTTYFIGDCDTEGKDHHGTPQQRECATLWGADEGLDMLGSPISARDFRSQFRKNLDMILSLDASVCHLSDDFSVKNPGPTGPISPIAYTYTGSNFAARESGSSLVGAPTMVMDAAFVIVLLLLA